MTQEFTTEPRDHLVVCTDCGATIDRAYAQPFLAMQQEGQVLDMRRRWVCLDDVRCHARGPIAQSAEELRADLEAAQTVIEELKAQLKAARGAQAATANHQHEVLEQSMRARLVLEIDFVRSIRALAVHATEAIFDGPDRHFLRSIIDDLINCTNAQLALIHEEHAHAPHDEHAKMNEANP